MCTTLEPVGCRTIMPCFDEPVFKAVFKVSVKVREANHVAISNSNVESIKTSQSGKWYNFKDTPYMSPYLLCLVIGKFEYIERYMPDHGITVRVYTPTNRKHQAEYSLDLAIESLKFYEEYFGIPYPLEKLDLVSIHNMDVRAMENWGCITFYADTFLMDRDSTPLSTIIRNERTVCHEISHMWFGNLVTMEWWTDIWLNEGFARFAEFMALDHIHPEYKVWDMFVTDVYEFGMKEDKCCYSHPVEIECNHPDEIEEIFDGIAYAKGASLIRMIRAFLGENTFRKAVSSYLNRNVYSNTKTSDLWKIFEEFSGSTNFKSMMSQWTKQKGFPIVDAQLKETNSKYQTWKFSQTSCHSQDHDYIWKIPMTYISSKGKVGKFMLAKPYELIMIATEPGESIKFDKDSTLFCEINYTQRNIRTFSDDSTDSSEEEEDINSMQIEFRNKNMKRLTKIDSDTTLSLENLDLLTTEKVSHSELYNKVKEVLDTL